MRRIVTVLVIEVAALACVITCGAALIGNNSRWLSWPVSWVAC